MRSALLFVTAASWMTAAPRVDNVLLKMVPPGTTSLVGARMDVLKTTDFYRKMVAAQKLPQIDKFAEESGFDPRRDVRELVYAEAPEGSVLLARGNFRVNNELLKNGKTTRHGRYQIVGQGTSGVCILDPTLAAAGEIPAIEAALDEWTSGQHTAAQPLLAHLKTVDERSQLWGFSQGAAGFLANNIPNTNSGIDFSKIFRGLDDTWFQADFSMGLRAEVHGTTATEKDALNLKDAVKGLVGLGRLYTPDQQPELIKLWDGILVEQINRSIVIRADIAQDLIERLIQMLSSVARPSTRI